MQKLQQPLSIRAIDSGPIGGGFVTTHTQPLTLQVNVLHQETIANLLTKTQNQVISLRFLWLQHHDPHISWQDRELLQWPTSYRQHCLHLPKLIIASTTMESQDVSTEVLIPECYRVHMEVFSKGRASGFPPHRPYDCAIELLPDTMSPHCQIYRLAISEQKAMCRRL